MSNDPRFEVYPMLNTEAPRKPTGEYGWRFRAANGQIIAVGGEGYTRIEDAERAVAHFVGTLVLSGADVIAVVK